MANVPTFHTKRLVLRELVESDHLAYQRYFANYEVIRHLTVSVPWPYPDGGALRYIQSDILPQQGKERWVWAIALKGSETELIGSVELLRDANPANRGFWLGEPFWGKGYMTEALEPVTEYAFNNLGFEKLIFTNAVGNKRSSRIKEKGGARLLRREPASYVDPNFIERELYELTKTEWQSQNATRRTTTS